MAQAIEKCLATLLLASRWLMAPLYLGLIAVLLIVVAAFFRERVDIAAGFAGYGARDVILASLKLIDLALLGNPLLIMIGAGFDTIVSHPAAERPQWMGKVDFAALKLKVMASIIAIAAVDLLETCFQIGTVDKSTVLWSILVFLAFIVGGILLAWMDRLASAGH